MDLNNSLPKIFLGIATRNHGWILPKYLSSILSLEYPRHLISLFFYVNDCEAGDESMSILRDFRASHLKKYRSIRVEEISFGVELDVRETNIRSRLYPHFAMLKNTVKDMFLKSGCDYWLQIDTDSPMKPDTLAKLLRHDKGYVCGMCNVDKNKQSITLNVIKKTTGRRARVDMAEIMRTRPGQLYKAWWVGGIALIRRDIAESCNYHVKKKGKDDNLGFCADVRKMGKEAWVDPEVFLEHYMVK